MKKGHVPFRTCRGCGRQAPRAELVRFVMVDGRIQEDTDKKMSGRGVYCCADTRCRTRFEKNKKMLKRVFRLHA